MSKLRLRANTIPPMTDSRGTHWEQPSRSEVYTDDTNAYMTTKSAKKLMRYDRSVPSGVYDGKMWVCLYGDEDHLLWFEPAEDPNMCATGHRKLVIMEVLDGQSN